MEADTPSKCSFDNKLSCWMLSKVLDMSSSTTTDIRFPSIFLRSWSVLCSKAVSVMWNFLFPLCKPGILLSLDEKTDLRKFAS